MAAAAPPPIFTVYDAMIVAGVDGIDNFNSQSSAERLTKDLFGDDFTACMDMTHEYIESNFKSLSSPTQTQG